MSQALRRAVERSFGEATEFLRRLIATPSLCGEEEECVELAKEAFSGLGLEVSEIAVPDSIMSDPLYSPPPSRRPYERRPNLVVSIGEGSPVLAINTHLDTVPPQGWKEAFEPRERGGRLYGRGACDAKGQIAAAYLALKAVCESGAAPRARVELQLVVEEETGGNGTLALLRETGRGGAWRGAVVLEPTSLDVCPAHRGCFWFRARTLGEGGHMGAPGGPPGANELAVELGTLLREFERVLVERAKKHPLFSGYERPVQVNLGVLRGGEWPATRARECLMEGGVGFAPPQRLDEVFEEMLRFVAARASDELSGNYELEMGGLRNEAMETPVASAVVERLRAAARASGQSPELRGLTASCDARLFQEVGGVPVVVFGAGSMEDAHSPRESVALDELKGCALVLAHLISG